MKKIILIALIACGIHVNAQQIIAMKSGEKMNGKVESLANGVVNFLYKGNLMKIKTDEIYSITFGEVGESAGGESTAALQKEIGEKQIMSGSYMVRYKVADRIVSKAPRVYNLTQEKGTVVVDVTIDKYGHVMKAIPGAPGSTTNSEYLKTKAKQAAESALFNNVPTAPLEQKGYMAVSYTHLDVYKRQCES